MTIHKGFFKVSNLSINTILDLENVYLKSQGGMESVNDSNIIKSLAKFEDSVNDAYQGGLFFESIEYARDAA